MVVCCLYTTGAVTFGFAASRVGWFCLLGFLQSIVPFLAVSRVAFLYHYLPGLLYAQLLVGEVGRRGAETTCFWLQ